MHEEPQGGTENLRNVRTLYCDSSAVLEAAVANGLDRSATIRTSSPGLIYSARNQISDRTAEITAETVLHLTERTQATSIAIRDNVRADPSISRFALPAAYAAVNATKTIMQAMTLRERDLEEPVAVGRLSTGIEDVDTRYNAPLPELLSGNPNLRIFQCHVGFDTVRATGMQVTPHVATRLRYLPWSNYEYRLWRMAWRYLPRSLSRGTFLIARDNQLLRDTCRSLARRGFSLQEVTCLRPTPTAISSDTKKSLWGATQNPLENLVCEVLSPKISIAMLSALRARITDAAGQYESSIAAWREALEFSLEDCPRGLLTNMLAGPHLVALYDACNERKIPVHSFQHGHARELNSTLAAYGAVLEEAATDLMFTYDDAAAIATEANPFSIAKAVSVGLPIDYIRAGRFRRRSTHAAPIVYVSTSAMTGYRLLPGACTWSDSEKAQSEIDLINRVLARLPHRVLFKPYPSSGYIDPSPVEQAVDEAENLAYFRGNYDLRYLLPDARVIITSRCTSTLGWCLAPNVPVVFIDLPDQLPPTRDFCQALERSVFYFNGRHPGWMDRVVRLLTQPLSDIDEAWETMKDARDQLLPRYIGSRDGKAGNRAAQHIVSYKHPDHYEA